MRPDPDPTAQERPRREGGEVIDLAPRATPRRAAPRSRPRRDWFKPAAGATVVAALGAVTLWTLHTARPPPAMRAASPTAPPALAIVPAAALPATSPPTAPGELAAPALAPVLGAMPTDAPSVRANPLDSPTVVFDAGVTGAGAASAAAPDLGPLAPAADPRATLASGTVIAAVLETAIDPAVPGLVRALVSVDVRTADGGGVLIARSSRLIGAYRGVRAEGQVRVCVTWTRLLRPDGSGIALAAPGADLTDAAFLKRFHDSALQSTVVGAGMRIRPGEPIRVRAAHDLDLGGTSR